MTNVRFDEINKEKSASIGSVFRGSGYSQDGAAGLSHSSEPVLRNGHGDTIRVNQIGDVEFQRGDSDSLTFYVSRHDLKELLVFLIEAIGSRPDKEAIGGMVNAYNGEGR